jgi:hypothetical protein
MIAAGIDVLNPIQWRSKGMEREGLKRDFGDQIIFHGGWTTSIPWPLAPSERGAAGVADNLRILGAGGRVHPGPVPQHPGSQPAGEHRSHVRDGLRAGLDVSISKGGNMYIGRFVIVGRTLTGEWYVGYRVSSRSFPNRYILPLEDRAVVLPTEAAPSSDNPYITYNCLRKFNDQVLVVANGSHVDPIIDKVQLGYGLRDAMALSLLALDYERDKYNTPRIAQQR